MLAYLQVMEDEFDVVLEDESHISVARDLCALWSASKSLAEAPIKDWETRADKASGKKVDVQVESKVKHVDEQGNEIDESDEDGRVWKAEVLAKVLEAQSACNAQYASVSEPGPRPLPIWIFSIQEIEHRALAMSVGKLHDEMFT